MVHTSGNKAYLFQNPWHRPTEHSLGAFLLVMSLRHGPSEEHPSTRDFVAIVAPVRPHSSGKSAGCERVRTELRRGR
jgi:hypothetical protein